MSATPRSSSTWRKYGPDWAPAVMTSIARMGNAARRGDLELLEELREEHRRLMALATNSPAKPF